jgi:hypothetical protein
MCVRIYTIAFVSTCVFAWNSCHQAGQCVSSQVVMRVMSSCLCVWLRQTYIRIHLPTHVCYPTGNDAVLFRIHSQRRVQPDQVNSTRTRIRASVHTYMHACTCSLWEYQAFHRSYEHQLRPRIYTCTHVHTRVMSDLRRGLRDRRLPSKDPASCWDRRSAATCAKTFANCLGRRLICMHTYMYVCMQICLCMQACACVLTMANLRATVCIQERMHVMLLYLRMYVRCYVFWCDIHARTRIGRVLSTALHTRHRCMTMRASVSRFRSSISDKMQLSYQGTLLNVWCSYLIKVRC